MTSEQPGHVPFQAHPELLRLFLNHRDEIVAKIQELLKVQQKSARYLQSGRSGLSRQFEDCFFTLPALSQEQTRLRGQLQAAHRASGFTPRDMPQVHNDLIDPGEMMIRALNFWRVSSWSGRDSRARFAQTLFNLYVLRCLVLLSMRIWDAGVRSAGERLSQVQETLDQLWRSAPDDQPVLVRDARWLIPIAQSPTNDGLGPYFDVVEHVAQSLAEQDRVEIEKANLVLAAGHLRSQLRHYDMQGASLTDHGVVLKSRRSNALDFAFMIQNLASLLEAYERAVRGGETDRRLELAGAICQGVSADPELFVNRIDLLGPYSMIEQLFVATDEQGRVAYTHAGHRHVRLLREYTTLIGRLSPSLFADCAHFRPVPGAYSPYGILFGFSSNIAEHMAMKTLLREPVTRFSLEDAFTEGDASSGKLEWVSGWRQLPHITPDVRKSFEYPQQFAAEIFGRIEHALRTSASGDAANAIPRTGRLFIVAAEVVAAGSQASQIPDLPLQYILSSDAEIVTAREASPADTMRLLRDRLEGEFAVSFQTQDGWVAIGKDFFTEILGDGRDVRIVGLPGEVAEVLRLMCLDLAQENPGAA